MKTNFVKADKDDLCTWRTPAMSISSTHIRPVFLGREREKRHEETKKDEREMKNEPQTRAKEKKRRLFPPRGNQKIVLIAGKERVSERERANARKRLCDLREPTRRGTAPLNERHFH